MTHARSHSLTRVEQPKPSCLIFSPLDLPEAAGLRNGSTLKFRDSPRLLGMCLANVRVLSHVLQERDRLCSANECSRRSLALPSGW